MRIQNNIIALNAKGNKRRNNKKISQSLEKLSSGYKINRAGDDAAGLTISEEMRAQIAGLEQGGNNISDGIAMCQVADGALDEVCAMLHRIRELSVASANGTYSQQAREHMQEEVDGLLDEINRIGETANYNGIPLFQGYDEILYNADGSASNIGDVPFGDFQLADVSLGKVPFTATSNSGFLGFSAHVSNPNSAYDGKDFSLIYGQGSTSSSSFRIRYQSNGTDQSEVIQLDSLTSSNFSQQGSVWKRDFKYTNADGVDITITQRVEIVDGDKEKTYKLSYAFKNEGTVKLDVDELIHFDTAYRNDDRCEAYYTNNNRIEKNTVYKADNSPYMQGLVSDNIISGTPPASVSIVNEDQALPFSEKITTDTKPSLISIGHYYQIKDWGYYDHVDPSLGNNTDNEDLGISLLYNFSLDAGGTNETTLNYGIVAVEEDANISNIPIVKDDTAATNHWADSPFWIQASSRKDDGMFIKIAEMNANVLGISGIHLTTISGAGNALNPLDAALDNVVKNRGRIGAEQNRLEHTANSVENTKENLIAAESRIRDTDIAEEMMIYTKNNILDQSSQAMLTQANQLPQRVLQLLQ